ncbi:Animal haem peroxidase [Bradyrhizobium arachidis]|uniref:Animal haem peroxidase n=2 Tax=Bradyrhizobium arachidis TaxID=858423 RepID=A0AAE7TL57_9BRAD|nr:hypothetical protein WN72_46040 [Bradyrhizobium arachidis]SFU37786.1 Animal haem peroxidase [Bradyrhizobium arachidis]
MASHGTISSTQFRRTAHFQPRSGEPGQDPGGFCHFISTPTEDQRFTLGGERFDPSDPDQWARAESLMKRLAHLIRFNPDENKARPNPNLPSGYTYFLQMVAHDLVHSAISTSLGEGQTAGLSNVRNAPLRLETVYGGGPTECPHAYEAAPVAFRSKLRLGNSRIDRDDQDHRGPRKDIARGTTSSAAQLARTASYPEALIADPRNDSHAIISQIVVLFHELHNCIVDELVRGGNLLPTANPFADAQRLFTTARTACVLIYRNLIRQDLLPRILHQDVWQAYTTDQKPSSSLDGGEWRAPLEFTNGFFRFGHSMIRPIYRFNGGPGNAFTIEQILARTSDKSPSDVPLETAWLVNWDLFFTSDPNAGNVSIRIGPWSQVGIGEEVPGEGDLIARDLLSSIAIQPWSIGPLVDRLRTTHGSLLDKSELLAGKIGSRPWAARISEWLAKRSDATFGSFNKLSEKEIKTLANDPPIPLFVRFEAGLDSGNQGERLGILGSIVVADVICGVLQSDRLLPDNPAGGLQSELASLSAATLGKAGNGQANIFAFLADIESPGPKISLTTVRRFLNDRQRVTQA